MLLIFDVTCVVTSYCEQSSYLTRTPKRIETVRNSEIIGANIIHNTLGLLIGICVGNPFHQITSSQEICSKKWIMGIGTTLSSFWVINPKNDPLKIYGFFLLGCKRHWGELWEVDAKPASWGGIYPQHFPKLSTSKPGSESPFGKAPLKQFGDVLGGRRWQENCKRIYYPHNDTQT